MDEPNPKGGYALTGTGKAKCTTKWNTRTPDTHPTPDGLAGDELDEWAHNLIKDNQDKWRWPDLAKEELSEYTLAKVAIIATYTALSQPAPSGDGDKADCGHANPIWFADNSLWNTVVGGEGATDDPGGILCPTCFMIKADRPLRISESAPSRDVVEAGGWRTDVENAPVDETDIEGLYPDGSVDLIFWREEGRHCVLGARAGSYPPGWCSRDADNLPVEEPICWRSLSTPQQTQPPTDKANDLLRAFEDMRYCADQAITGGDRQVLRGLYCEAYLKFVQYLDAQGITPDEEQQKRIQSHLQESGQ